VLLMLFELLRTLTRDEPARVSGDYIAASRKNSARFARSASY
jgi:hypothetical protein